MLTRKRSLKTSRTRLQTSQIDNQFQKQNKEKRRNHLVPELYLAACAAERCLEWTLEGQKSTSILSQLPNDWVYVSVVRQDTSVPGRRS